MPCRCAVVLFQVYSFVLSCSSLRRIKIPASNTQINSNTVLKVTPTQRLAQVMRTNVLPPQVQDTSTCLARMRGYDPSRTCVEHPALWFGGEYAIGRGPDAYIVAISTGTTRRGSKSFRPGMNATTFGISRTTSYYNRRVSS